jgi:hypothetical protein
MHETVLRDFFAGTTDAVGLRKDFIGTLTVADDSLEYEVVKMAEPFRVTPKHLVRLCDAVIDKSLPLEILQPIGLCVIGSDHFAWADTATGDLVADTLNDWASPETNYPLTPATIKLFRERLLTGKDVLKTHRPT